MIIEFILFNNMTWELYDMIQISDIFFYLLYFYLMIILWQFFGEILQIFDWTFRQILGGSIHP